MSVNTDTVRRTATAGAAFLGSERSGIASVGGQSRGASGVDRADIGASFRPGAQTKTPPRAAKTTPPRWGSTRLRSFVLSAIMLGSSFFPGGNALAQTAQQIESASEPAAITMVQTDRDQKDAIVASLAKGTLNGPPSPETVKKLQQDLSAYPLPVLKALQMNGYSLVITHGGANKQTIEQKNPNTGETEIGEIQEPGENLLDANVFKAAAPADFTTPEALRGTAMFRENLQHIEDQMTPMIADAEKAQADAMTQAKNPPAGTTDYNASARVERASSAVTSLYTMKARLIDFASLNNTDETLNAVRGDGFPMNADGKTAAPATIGDLAKLHEASTPDQMNEFVGLIKTLNPDLMKNMSVEQIEKAPLSQFGKQYVIYPDFYYDVQPHTGKVLRIFSYNHEDVMDWANNNSLKGGGITEGETWDDIRVIALRTGQIGVLTHGINTSIHEVGHAIENILDAQHPGFSKVFHKALNEAFQRAKDNDCFITGYASQDKDEFFAESVGAYYTSSTTNEKLKAIDPDWYKMVERAIQEVQKPPEAIHADDASLPHPNETIPLIPLQPLVLTPPTTK